MKIIVEQYNPNWTNQFQVEQKSLIETIPEENIIIEHIGSTAVPNLCAKPVIDIMIGIFPKNKNR